MTAKCSIAAGLFLLPFVAPAQILNPGFELAGDTPASATNWIVTQAVGGPVYALRTNSSPRSGAWHFEVHLASTGAGPVVEFTQAGIQVTGGTNYPLTFHSKALTGSAGFNAQWRVVWNAGGDTGFRAYTPGNNVYAFVSNSISAPAAATSANLYFYFAGAAIPSQSATLQIDDVSFGGTNEVVVVPGDTNPIVASITRASGIRWFASNSVTYQVQWSGALLGSNTVWSNFGSAILGNGTTNTVYDAAGPTPRFYQVLAIQ